MSDILQRLLQVRAEPNPEAKWPQWIADALAYKPETSVPEVPSLIKVAPSEDRRNIRVLSRMPQRVIPK